MKVKIYHKMECLSEIVARQDVPLDVEEIAFKLGWPMAKDKNGNTLVKGCPVYEMWCEVALDNAVTLTSENAWVDGFKAEGYTVANPDENNELITVAARYKCTKVIVGGIGRAFDLNELLRLYYVDVEKVENIEQFLLVHDVQFAEEVKKCFYL